MPDTTPRTGGCGCGAVRFALDAAPLDAGYCHCTRCQHRTGTALSASARVERGTVRVTQGSEELRTWRLDDGLGKVFCGLCGAALFAADREDGTPLAVRMAAFDEDPGVRPSLHQFTAYAAVWAPIPDDGLPRHPERRPS